VFEGDADGADGTVERGSGGAGGGVDAAGQAGEPVLNRRPRKMDGCPLQAKLTVSRGLPPDWLRGRFDMVQYWTWIISRQVNKTFLRWYFNLLKTDIYIGFLPLLSESFVD